MAEGLAARLSERLADGERSHRRIRLELLALSLVLALAVQMLRADLPAARQLEAHAHDLLTRVMAREANDPRIAIVDIDEDSLKRVGPWPWPRQTLADLAERLLGEAGAAVVAFDLVLTDPATTEEGRTGDARLAALGARGWLVPAQAFDYVARDQPVQVGVPGGGRSPSAADGTGDPAGAATARATGHVANFAALSAARCVGNIGFLPDSDGKIRRIALWTRWNDARYPAYALAVLGCAQPGLDLSRLSSRIPVDPNGQWSIPFAHSTDSYFAIPAVAVLSGSLGALPPPVAGARAGTRPLEGRIAVVGSSALGLADRVATPLSSSVSGVTVHAAALSALLDAAAGRSPTPPPAWAMPAWLAVSVCLLWLAVAAGRRLRPVLAVLFVTLGAWAVLAGWMTATGVSQAVSGPLWGYGVTLLLHLPIEWSWAQARVRSRTRLLSRYVARQVLDELLATGTQDPLAPRYAEITVLIADMQDYTRLTSRSSLQDAAELTRGFLEQLTGPVLEHRGTLDRYTGDGLVSFWGAPVAMADHADQAIDAAIEIQRNVARYNERRRASGLDEVTARIGIASGSALVGDLGTPFRIAYTAVGDCINLASRLQQLTRELDVGIAVSSSAVGQCRRWSFTPLGTVSIRGLPDQPVFTPREPAPRPDSPPAARAAGAFG